MVVRSEQPDRGPRAGGIGAAPSAIGPSTGALDDASRAGWLNILRVANPSTLGPDIQRGLEILRQGALGRRLTDRELTSIAHLVLNRDEAAKAAARIADYCLSRRNATHIYIVGVFSPDDRHRGTSRRAIPRQ